ncbi:MAG: penicillin-binding protein 2 [Patescibacteria group bacterium]|nr:penicillin-binding protein 2 [Patescibacteria group bacterium]
MPLEDLTNFPNGNPFPLQDDDAAAWRVQRLHDVSTIEELPSDEQPENAGWHYLGVSVSTQQIRRFFVLLAVVFGLLLMRLGQLQIAKGDEYRRLAEGNRSRIETVRSQRGIIYARDGTPLVHNVPNFSAYVAPGRLPTDEAAKRTLLLKLADAVGRGPADIEAALAAGRREDDRPVLVADRLTGDQAVLVSIVAAANDAISLDVGSRREYAETISFSHLIGYEGRVSETDLQNNEYQPTDQIGKAGLERQYEETLRGKYGRQVYEVDAAGRRKGLIAEDPGIDGGNLELTVDLDLQRAATAFLKNELNAAGKKRGSVVVLDPKTGEVLALVSEPGFDNNLFAKGIAPDDFRKIVADPDNPLFNRAIGASLPAGSVFKPVVAAAALEEGTITSRTSVVSTGGISVGAWRFPDWKAGGHGVTDVRKAIAESVNTFFYAIGGGYDKIPGLGVERIVAYARRFGLGEKLGIDLVGENAGFLPSKEWKQATKGEKWYIGDTYHLAIGQGDLLVTPLQVAAYTAAFANGGRLMRPYLVGAIMNGSSERRPTKPETLNQQVVSRETIDIVRQGMRQTVTAGSARSLANLPVAVAAKTGTAQWHSDRPTHAWFTSFAPYDDPQLVVTVNIEEGGEGSVTSAQVAKNIYQWYFLRHPAKP